MRLKRRGFFIHHLAVNLAQNICGLETLQSKEVVGSLAIRQPGRENGFVVVFRAELFSDDFPTRIWSSLKLPLKEQDWHSQ